MSSITTDTAVPASGQLHRTIDWRGAFWVASGVPALVLFSIGGIAGTTGNLAFAIWIASVILGLIQSFTYAEIAGLFPSKSGGASVYGATAWLRYSKFIAPLSVWCNWLAWTPVLSLGCSIAAAYILSALAPIPGFGDTSPEVVAWLADPVNAGKTAADAIAALTAAGTPAIRDWTLYSGSLGPVSFSLNAIFWIGVVLMLIVFAVQHRGILRTANVQKYVGLIVIIPMLIVGIVPILTGQINWDNYSPFVPLAAAYAPEPGEWNIAGWTLVFGGMFIAAWSAYAFETSICFTSEFKNPARDTVRAILYSGLLCLVLYSLVPFTFQGVLGLEGMLATPIVDGSGVGNAMAADGRRHRHHHLDHDHADDPGADAGDHDGDGRFLAHALPGFRRRLAAALPQPRQPAWRADGGDVDRPRLQPVPAGDRGGGRDELLLHPRRLELRLHHLQLPQPQRRLDPPHRQRPHPAAVEGADHLHRGRLRACPSSTPCSWAPAPRSGTRGRCGPASSRRR